MIDADGVREPEAPMKFLGGSRTAYRIDDAGLMNAFKILEVESSLIRGGSRKRVSKALQRQDLD